MCHYYITLCSIINELFVVIFVTECKLIRIGIVINLYENV